MRPYPPTLRERRRYIGFKAHGKAGEKEVSRAIQSSMLSLFGEDGYARANFSVIEYANGVGICRCTHDWLDNCLVALAFVQEIGGKPGRISAFKVSGTVKNVRRAKAFK